MFGPSEKDGTLTRMEETDREQINSVNLIYHEPLYIYEKERELRRAMDWEALTKPIYGKVAFGLMLEDSRDLMDQLIQDLDTITGSDGHIRFRGGAPFLIIRREGVSMREAVLQSIEEICALMEGYIRYPVLRVEPGDEINQAEIARRLKRSSESIRLYYHKMRGQGLFPEPLSGRTNRPLIWSWVDVLQWASNRLMLNHPRILENAIDIKSINLALGLRTRVGKEVRYAMKAAYTVLEMNDKIHRGEDRNSRIRIKEKRILEEET